MIIGALCNSFPVGQIILSVHDTDILRNEIEYYARFKREQELYMRWTICVPVP
jgi:hypothetical protein